jgi:predicted ribosomally synthesized peptide with SipW-like signal peptide
MKRLIFPIVLILLLTGVMAYGISGTGAWFTDMATIDNNSISTGNIDLVLSDVRPSTPLLEPGGKFQEMLRFCITNGGSFNMKWRGIFTKVNAPEGMADQILISMVSNPENTFAGNFDSPGRVLFADVPVSSLVVPNTHLLLDPSTNKDPFKPKDKVCYSILARLNSTAGDSFKQSDFSASLQLNATQWINSTEKWTE